MKTIEEIAIECASKSGHSYTDVENFKPHNWVLEAMHQYAKQCCEEQIKACAEDAHLFIMNKQAILSTPNVVK